MRSSRRQASRGADFEFETDPANKLVEVRKGRAFRGLATPITISILNQFQSVDRANNINTQVTLNQTTNRLTQPNASPFHLEFHRLATPNNKRGKTKETRRCATEVGC